MYKRQGDNDTLAAVVCNLVDADCLVILSDIDGLYTANPYLDKSAKLVQQVEQVNDALLRTANGTGSELGTGGMLTKLAAAKIALEAGCLMAIVNGSRLQNLYDLVEGRPAGTIFGGDLQ